MILRGKLGCHGSLEEGDLDLLHEGFHHLLGPLHFVVGERIILAVIAKVREFLPSRLLRQRIQVEFEVQPVVILECGFAKSPPRQGVGGVVASVERNV